MAYLRLCLLLRSLYKRLDIFHGCLEDNICYFHMPKCGGTSINHAIMQRYSRGNLIIVNAGASFKAAKIINQIDSDDIPNLAFEYFLWLKFQENILLYFMNQRKTKYVSGHYSFNETVYRKFYDKYRFVTVLRHPVKRWISEYLFIKHGGKEEFITELDIKTYMKSEIGKLLGCSYVISFGGASESTEYYSKEAIDKAKMNLNKFDIVGCLENLKDFKKQFERRFGVRLKIGRKNRNPKPDSYQKIFVTEEIEEKIKNICKPDLEIYQYALDNFVKGI